MCGNYILSSLVSSFFVCVCFQASSSHCLEPYLSTNACLQGCFFFLVLCSYGNDCNTESPFARFQVAVRGLPKGRRISRQNQTALKKSGSDSMEEEVCFSCHMRLQRPPFPFFVTARWGKFVLSPSLTPKLNGCKVACNIVLCSCSCKILLMCLSVNCLKEIIFNSSIPCSYSPVEDLDVFRC